ncbi:MAG: sugar nucleotide-binding protein [Eubacterium sp.]
MKILVLGANGMAGHTIVLYFKEQGHDVTGFTTTPIDYCKNIVGDALDKDYFKDILLQGHYDAVINCIGLLNETANQNPDQAVYLNSYLPHAIVKVLEGTKTKMIQMSTDCVFSGKTGIYKENSLRDGETFYDRSKGLGEVDDHKNLTFRNSIIGPDMNEKGIGLFNWFMKQKGTINGYTGAIWTGVTTLTLAKAMEQGIKENLTGIYNLVNNTLISKYDLLKLFNHFFKQDTIEIRPSNALNLNKSLCNTRDDFSFEVPSYETMIQEMKVWVNSHQIFYPHYRENN